MPAFKFRMQSYYDLKIKLEDQAKLDYSISLMKLEEARIKQQRLEAELQGHINSFRQAVQNRIDPARFQRLGSYIELVKKHIAQQAEQVRRAEKVAEQKRFNLVEAMKQRRMLENLYNKAKERYVLEAARAEAGIVDESISYRLSRQRR